MTAAIRNGARGGRYAKRFAKQERFTDSLYDQGVLTRPEDAREKALAARELVIDDEFKALIPAQTAEETAALEESILRDGCRDALTVWQGRDILVDGHHRYEICARHNLPFEIHQHAFESREDVIVWMVQNQLARRNITSHMRIALADRMTEAISKKARENQLSGLKKGNESPDFSNLSKRESVRTDAKIAELSNSSTGSVHKVRSIERTAPEPIKQKSRNGGISIDRAYKMTQALKGANPRVIGIVDKLNIDEPKRVEILIRLHKSSGSPTTNGTFDEIESTGGFHYGEAMRLWCDFANDPIEDVEAGLADIAEQHKIIAAQDKKARLEQAADIKEVVEPPAPRVYAEGEIVELCGHTLICADNRSPAVREYLKKINAALVFCDPPYNTGKFDWDLGDFDWEQDFLMEHAKIVAVTPGIGNIPGFMRQTAMPYRWSTSTLISNGMTRGALGFGNWIYTALFAKDSIHRNAQDVTTISISTKDTDELGAKRQKPPAYLAWLFELLTKPNDTIVDAFGGSGTSVIVAGRLNRRCICIEKDVQTFTAMVQRIEAEYAHAL